VAPDPAPGRRGRGGARELHAILSLEVRAGVVVGPGRMHDAELARAKRRREGGEGWRETEPAVQINDGIVT